MIELAWFWLRHQPDTALSRWFHTRVGAAKGRVRRIGNVGQAKKDDALRAGCRRLHNRLRERGAIRWGNEHLGLLQRSVPGCVAPKPDGDDALDDLRQRQ